MTPVQLAPSNIRALAEIYVLRGTNEGLAVVLGHTLPEGEVFLEDLNKLVFFHNELRKKVVA